MAVSRKIVLHFPAEVADRPIVCDLALRFGLAFNILRASISPHREGIMVMEIIGEGVNQEKGLQYLREQGVLIESLSQDIRKNDERCINCGACVGVCPTSALFIEKPSFEVCFDGTKCIACEMCIMACPTFAMEALI